MDTSICKELITKLLRTRPCTRAEIVPAVSYALPEDMEDEWQKGHVSYLLQELRKEHRIRPDGARRNAKWMIDE